MLRSVALALALLLPRAAWSEAWSWGCGFTNNLTPSRPTEFTIRHGNIGCYRFVDTDSTSTSDLIVVDAESALWCFDPDNTDASTDTARVTIHYCPMGGVGGGTGSVNTCINLGGFNGNSALSGTEGTDSVQNACKRTGPGVFFIRVTAACTKSSTNYCQVSVKGEGVTN